MPEAFLQTGNGITLCPRCHRRAHKGFNGRPNLQLPMDAQGGEKIETLAKLYERLFADASLRGVLRNDFYFLSESVLGKFRVFQGFETTASFQGGPLEQACRIWKACPQHMLNAVLAANGLTQQTARTIKFGDQRVYYVP